MHAGVEPAVPRSETGCFPLKLMRKKYCCLCLFRSQDAGTALLPNGFSAGCPSAPPAAAAAFFSRPCFAVQGWRSSMTRVAVGIFPKARSARTVSNRMHRCCSCFSAADLRHAGIKYHSQRGFSWKKSCELSFFREKSADNITGTHREEDPTVTGLRIRPVRPRQKHAASHLWQPRAISIERHASSERGTKRFRL